MGMCVYCLPEPSRRWLIEWSCLSQDKITTSVNTLHHPPLPEAALPHTHPCEFTSICKAQIFIYILSYWSIFFRCSKWCTSNHTPYLICSSSFSKENSDSSYSYLMRSLADITAPDSGFTVWSLDIPPLFKTSPASQTDWISDLWCIYLDLRVIWCSLS